MYPNRTRQRGVGLPVALFVITVLALIVVALTDLEETSGISFSVDINSMRAFYAAESGAQIAVNSLFPPSGAPTVCASPAFTQAGLNGCNATVTCNLITVDSVDYHTIRSTGRCGSGIDQAERVIEVRVRQ